METSLTPAERAALVDRYRGGYAALAAAVTAAAGRLDHQPDDGGWTPRQIVHHVADGETRSAVRLRRLLAEDAPVIQGYDQDAYAAALRYDRPVETALAVVQAVRVSSAELLDALTDAEWARTGSHTESGTYGVEDWLRIYAAHPYDHADQLRRAVG